MWSCRYLLLLLIWSIGVTTRVDCQDVIVDVIQPDSQRYLCPNQLVMYKCRIPEPTAFLAWEHLAGGMLEFTTLSRVNDSVSRAGGKFTAVLTVSIMEGDSARLTSVLTIQPDLSGLNGTLVTCRGDTTEPVENSISITLSGTADSPLNLSQDTLANAEFSTVIQWQTPLYTGGEGISLMEYTVTANGQTNTVPVSNDKSDMLIYTITGLSYNTDYTVKVTAINSCGQESEPANLTVNIEARAPPTPLVLSPELSCDVSLKDGRAVVINWMYGDEEVYPEVVAVTVELDPGNVVCSDVTADDSNCTVIITRDDNYTVNLTVMNDVGSTQAALYYINSNQLQVESRLNSASSPSITVTLNRFCRTSVNYVVSFGVTESDNETCDVKQNVTVGIMPGVPETIAVNTTIFMLEHDQEYCYLLSPDRDLDTNNDRGDDNRGDSFPIGGIIGVVIGAVVMISITTTMVLIALYKLRNKLPLQD